MLKRTQLLTIVLLSSLSFVHAEVPAVKQGAQVVVVSIQEIALSSKKFAVIQKDIEREVHKKGGEIEALKAEFEAIVKKLQSGAKDMNQAALQQQQEKLASLKGQIEVKQQGLQAYAEREMRAAEEKLVKEIQDVCKKLGFDIVVPGALYVKPEFDKTALVIAEMDKGVVAGVKDAVKKGVDDVATSIKSKL